MLGATLNTPLERDADTRHATSALLVRDGMSFADWTAVGRRLAQVSSASAWALGDWLLYGRRAFRDRYRTAIDATRLDYQTLRNYASVASRIDPPRRRESLSFQHHAEVAALSPPEQDLWLGRAESAGWSRNQLRRQLAEHRSAARSWATDVRVVVSVEVSRTDELRWRQAAASRQQNLKDWVRAVTDAAAEETLSRGGE
jgi:hypothetical protein